MAAVYQLPGGGYLSEASESEYQVPGVGYAGETQAAVGGGDPPALMGQACL